MPQPLRYLLIVVTAAMLLYTMYRSWHFTTQNGGTDLRSRVVGARMVPTAHSPYYYKWKPADGEYYLNPNDVARRVVNGNVATPALLYAIYPVSAPSYTVVRPLWTVLQYAACFALLFLLLYKQPGAQATVAACLVVGGLVCTTTWQYGIERGQVYILYAFLFAGMYRLYISRVKSGEFWSGLIGGLFIFFRPFAAIIAIGFVLHGKKKWLLGWVAGIVLGTCLFVFPDTSLWKDYFSAMQEYTNESMGQPHQVINAVDPPKPTTIEGMNTLRSYRVFTAIEISAVYGYFARNNIWLSPGQLFFVYGGIVLLLSVFFWRLRKKVIHPQAIFLFGFLLYILAELFNLAPRASYNVIQWLFPLTIILLYVRPFTPLFMTLAAAFLLLHAFPFRRFPWQGEITELIFFGVTGFFIFFPRIVKKWQYGISRT